MRKTPLATLMAVALVASAAGCGGSDDAVVDQTGNPTEQQTEQEGEQPAEPAGAAENDSAASFDADDICSNLSVEEVSAILDLEVSEPMTGVGTCFYFLPDREMVGVAVVGVDQVNEPTPESVCEGSAQLYSDVETSSIVGYPAFAGVDVGSVEDTFVVCPPGFQLYFSGSPTRDLLAELATAFLS